MRRIVLALVLTALIGAAVQYREQPRAAGERAHPVRIEHHAGATGLDLDDHDELAQRPRHPGAVLAPGGGGRRRAEEGGGRGQWRRRRRHPRPAPRHQGGH